MQARGVASKTRKICGCHQWILPSSRWSPHSNLAALLKFGPRREGTRYEISRALGNGNESGAAAADIIARGKAGTLAGWREGELGFVKGKTPQVP